MRERRYSFLIVLATRNGQPTQTVQPESFVWTGSTFSWRFLWQWWASCGGERYKMRKSRQLHSIVPQRFLFSFSPNIVTTTTITKTTKKTAFGLQGWQNKGLSVLTQTSNASDVTFTVQHNQVLGLVSVKPATKLELVQFWQTASFLFKASHACDGTFSLRVLNPWRFLFL